MWLFQIAVCLACFEKNPIDPVSYKGFRRFGDTSTDAGLMDCDIQMV
jgi:hypothetical protein